MKPILYLFPLALVLMVQPVCADNFDVQVLAAAFPPANNSDAKVVGTTNGPGIQHRGQSLTDVVIYCPVNADAANYFDWFQMVAEDNTTNGHAQAILWRANTSTPMPAEAIYTVTTKNQSGVQVVADKDVDITLDPVNYVYWIELRIVRHSPDAVVTVYSAGLLDVF